MAMKRMLVMLPVALCIGDQAGPPRASLMQSGSSNKKVSLTAEGESMLTGGSVSHALAGFQKFADDLVIQYKKTGLPMDEDTQKAIGTVIQYIHGMYDRLVAWHNLDVSRTTACSTSKYNRCVDDHFDSDTVQQITNLGQMVAEQRAKVRSCALNASDTSKALDTDCQDYDDYRKGQGAYAPEWPELPKCVDPNGHLDDSHISTGLTEQRTTMETCLKQMKTWFMPLFAKYLKCPVPRGGELFPCTSHQNNFEETHCQWSGKKADTCHAYQICKNEVDADCGDSFCSEIQVNVNARKAENETGERIICLLDVLVNSSNTSKPGDLDTCKNKTYDTSEFKLDCPADGEKPADPPIDCADFEPVPCTPGFLLKEYRSPSAPAFMEEVIVLCECHKCDMVQPVVAAPEFDKDDFGNFVLPLTCSTVPVMPVG